VTTAAKFLASSIFVLLKCNQSQLFPATTVQHNTRASISSYNWRHKCWTAGKWPD